MLCRLALLAALAAPALAQLTGYWSCGHTQAINDNEKSEDLDLEQFTKVTWYENKRYDKFGSSFESGTRCNKWNFAQVGENDLEINASFTSDSGDNSGAASLTADARFGDYILEFTKKPFEDPAFDETWEFKILATDNTEWALVWMCQSYEVEVRPGYIQKRHKQLAWFLTNSKNPSDATLDTIRTAARYAGLYVLDNRLEVVDQSC